MITQLIKDGDKNLSVAIKGFIYTTMKRTVVMDLDQLKKPPNGWRGLRLDSALWMIEEKMGFNLWWEDEETEASFILPMQSRNYTRLDEGIPSPRVSNGWSGKIWMSSFNFGKDVELVEPMRYLIILDFDKQ